MLEPLLSADETLLRLVLSWPHPAWLNWLMQAASYAGVGGGIWLAMGLALTLMRAIRFSDFVRLVIAIALVHLVVDVLIKPTIGRVRPPLAMPDLSIGVDVPESKSFPSGHAANAVAAAFVLHRLSRRARPIVWTAAAIVVVARVYLGVHYPLDALAGSLVGLLCGWVVLLVHEEKRGGQTAV